jgi:hypothetical protein
MRTARVILTGIVLVFAVVSAVSGQVYIIVPERCHIPPELDGPQDPWRYAPLIKEHNTVRGSYYNGATGETGVIIRNGENVQVIPDNPYPLYRHSFSGGDRD